MASHAGLKYVLETKKGFVSEDGSYIKDIEKALVINFERFGFGPSALTVFHRLGFNDEEIIESSDISFHTVVPSYDSRLGYIEDCYQEMGKDYRTACMSAEWDFRRLGLQNDERYFDYIGKLREEVKDYYLKQPVTEILRSRELELHEVKDGRRKYYNPEENVQDYYSKIGKVYKYEMRLKNPHLERYFNLPYQEIQEYNEWQSKGLLDTLVEMLNTKKDECSLPNDFEVLEAKVENGKIVIYMKGFSYNAREMLNKTIRRFYETREMHVTRMFGSYILLQKLDGELKAVLATEVPIKYCPLMVKLLKEVGGAEADELILALQTEDKEKQKRIMCDLINRIVIKGGYFDTSRPLNSCEVNVLFGASETLSSAFKEKMIDAAVMVSNNLGTIITTNDENTQGTVKRMTGLFYTSPSEELVRTAEQSRIRVVFPYTAEIDQLAGVKKAIDLGYKRIAVTVAAMDNYLLEEIKKIETDGVKIYKFGLCSTGIDEKTAQIMRDNADIVWSCASKYVKELIEPNAIAQVGVKIPVHIMTKQGWEIVKNHLKFMNSGTEVSTELTQGENKPVILNDGKQLKLLKKCDIHNCEDCPSPCV